MRPKFTSFRVAMSMNSEHNAMANLRFSWDGGRIALALYTPEVTSYLETKLGKAPGSMTLDGIMAATETLEEKDVDESMAIDCSCVKAGAVKASEFMLIPAGWLSFTLVLTLDKPTIRLRVPLIIAEEEFQLKALKHCIERAKLSKKNISAMEAARDLMESCVTHKVTIMKAFHPNLALPSTSSEVRAEGSKAEAGADTSTPPPPQEPSIDGVGDPVQQVLGDHSDRKGEED